tara:strand:- start:6299 stop:7219 length:921 start_codon:yes stop_codon:yes gene_type:complete
MSKLLSFKGYRVIGVDNHSTSPANWVHSYAEKHSFDIRDTDRLTDLMKKENVEVVLHFAAKAIVSESQQTPFYYYRENIDSSISLLEAMNLANVSKLVFSSTCATYGIHEEVISEETEQKPVNTYGLTKKIVEDLIKDQASKKHIQAVILRYFNVAGCDPHGAIGENHEPETHLIPNLCQSILNKGKFCVYGDNFKTKDGSAVRDYIHVEDLVYYHYMALDYMQKNNFEWEAFNLGSGAGYSVLEVINVFKEITGNNFSYEIQLARVGDPACLVANNTKSKSVFEYQPKYSLKDMIEHTFNYLKSH